MKNLVVYVMEGGGSDDSYAERLLRLQVDASLELGWDAGDLVILTSFPFAWQGVRAEVVTPPPRPSTCRATSFYKTWCILELIRQVGDGETIWYHDADAYQLAPLTGPPTDRALSFCLYSTRERLLVQGGSLFISSRARPVFEWVWDCLVARGCRKDEFALTDAVARAEHAGLFAAMDYSYNLGSTDFELRYQLAQPPVKVVHFHPLRPDHRRLFVEARNGLGVDPLTLPFRRVLVRHGFAEPALAERSFRPTLEPRPVEYRSTSPLGSWLHRLRRPSRG